MTISASPARTGQSDPASPSTPHNATRCAVAPVSGFSPPAPGETPGHTVAAHHEYGHLDPVLARYAVLSAHDPDRTRLQDELATGFLPVARNLARRYRGRGEPLADLEQVATVGLVKAIDRFRPDYERPFLAFAVPTITGELRRHFRDQTWVLRVPRRLKDLHVAINHAVVELYPQLGRAPRPSELATHLGISITEVLEALQAGHAYTAISLDRPTHTPDSGPSPFTLGDHLGNHDRDLDRVEIHETLQPLLAQLPPRDRDIIVMRFHHDMTQTQIADQIGVSQMQVSRILARILTGLRATLDATDPLSS